MISKMGFVMSEMGFPKIVVPAAISCSVCCSAVGFVYQVCLVFWRFASWVCVIHRSLLRMYANVSVVFLEDMPPFFFRLYQFGSLWIVCPHLEKQGVEKPRPQGLGGWVGRGGGIVMWWAA